MVHWKQHAQLDSTAQHRALAVHPCLAAQCGWGLSACCCKPENLAGCCAELQRQAPICDAASAQHHLHDLWCLMAC